MTHRTDTVAEGACFYCETGAGRAGTLSLCPDHSVMVLEKIRGFLSPLMGGELHSFAMDR